MFLIERVQLFVKKGNVIYVNVYRLFFFLNVFLANYNRTCTGLHGHGRVRPVARANNPNCWKCEPSPEELSKCDVRLLSHDRECGILESRFEEHGYHCIVEVLKCFPKFSSANRAEASFIVASGRIIDSPDSNDTSERYFPLNSPAGVREVFIPCTLNGTWEAVLPARLRIQVTQIQCIVSPHQTMNHISPYITEIFR
ncbi:unnamed protein product [Thelazia callipaeda]|uniref:Laminin N-terminal domain-containing protein n=1 Tax=Thelazia callipaeda TaxID=103827 RepID=A0A0N5CYP8_THECL|nr:unnamed protein product [Thelazia callipaeda]